MADNAGILSPQGLSTGEMLNHLSEKFAERMEASMRIHDAYIKNPLTNIVRGFPSLGWSHPAYSFTTIEIGACSPFTSGL
jgi:hypothetical protein